VRYRGTVNVSVDVSDVLDELSNEDLRDELVARRTGVPLEGVGSDWFERMRWFLLRRDVNSALAMLESEAVRGLVAEEARAAQYAAMKGETLQ
jgi:hypothetical protein